MKKYLLRTMTGLGLVLAGTGAQATKIETVYTQTQVSGWTPDQVAQALAAGAKFAPGTFVYTKTGTLGSGGGYIYVDQDSIYAAGVAANQNSTVVTEVRATQVATQEITNMITARIDERQGRGGNAGSANSTNLFKGGNAGSLENKFAVWGRADWTRIDDNTAGGKWDANLWTLVLGGDYKFHDRMLAGLSFTYSYMHGKTKFNNGKIQGDHGFGVAPYMNVRALDWLDFDAIVGYTRVNKDRSRTAVGTGQKVTAKPHSDRWYATLAANAHHQINRWALLGRLGYNHAQDKQKSFTETNGDRYTSQTVKMNRVFARLQGGYQVNESMMPYLFLTYAYDFTMTKLGLASESANAPLYQNPEKNRGKHTYGGGLGLSFVKGQNWTGGIEYGYAQAKKVRTHNANLRLRYAF